MVQVIDPSDPRLATRIVEIQRAAYAVEAELIGFNGIPQLSESAEQVQSLTALHWRAVVDDGVLAGIIAWTEDDALVDIDRLAVDPAASRRGYGRRLVQSVPVDRRTVVSTGAKNDPALALYRSEGFEPTHEVELVPGVFLAHLARPEQT